MQNFLDMIEKFCMKDSLATYDPYDIWKTPMGFEVKDLYNRRRTLGLLPGALLTFFDTFINNKCRTFYKSQEYPIVRAFAALCLLNIHKAKPDQQYLACARRHLFWLIENSCSGYSGLCWGLGFNYAVCKDFSYDSNMPLSTITPYPLEAFIEYKLATGSTEFDQAISSIYRFYENDIVIMEETDKHLITSYAAMRDRVVINAISYSMYAYALLLPFAPSTDHKRIHEKIRKMYFFVRNSQSADGSWVYSPEGKSFIDCFHSCIVLKNLIKTNRLISLPECPKVVERGYAYLIKNMYDTRAFLFKRFSVKNKPTLVKYDLYDNAEMLNLAYLMNDQSLINGLSESTLHRFCRGNDIYSQIIGPGILRNKNMLRWAVMPYLYAISEINLMEQKHD